MRRGESFENTDVVSNYRYRPAYPAAVFERLSQLPRQRGSLLDLGCGPGKISSGLHQHFAQVTAVDPSAAMLAAARLNIDADNVTFTHSLAESAEFANTPYDLIVAAASVHWMDHAVLFPKLQRAAHADHIFAVVEGDDAHQPPWQENWDQFLGRWIYELNGATYEPDNQDSAHHKKMTAYRDWIDIQGSEVFEAPVSQSIEDFIACQHSRDTFAPIHLGERIHAFDDELRALLTPHAINGQLTYRVQTRVEWGRIRLA